MGGWRPGDPEGQRRFLSLNEGPELTLESGEVLHDIQIAYESWGELNAERSNAVLLLHGFSGDSHAAGPAGPGHVVGGWWAGLIGPGRAIDTNRFHVLCPNVLGGCQGSTGPWSQAPDGRAYGSRFPVLTIRDLVATEQRWANALGIERWFAVIGGSLGGMRALEWAISSPERLERLVILATTAASSPENRAFHSTQIRAIKLDPAFQGGDYYDGPDGGPFQGLALARSIARLTYGCERELSLRFQLGESEAVEKFLQDDGEALCRRFDANSYIVLTNAMSNHDVGRGRGGIANALAKIKARTRIVSVESDRLFPPHQQRELARHLHSGVTYTSIDSTLGHDGFLGEQRQLAPVLRQSLG
jgi:homoserine O-acetyltransferase